MSDTFIYTADRSTRVIKSYGCRGFLTHRGTIYCHLSYIKIIDRTMSPSLPVIYTVYAFRIDQLPK